METIRVGYSRVEFTPDYMVSLAGYGNYARRVNENTIDRLYVSCFAITDSQDTTMLLYNVDMANMYTELSEPLRQLVAAAYGLPFENIMLNASHSHSAPLLSMASNAYNCGKIRAEVSAAVLKAAHIALDDRSEATVFATKAEIQDLNYVKHYKMNDGTYGGDNHGNFKSGIACHATEPDKEMRFVKFCREGKKDLLLYNWQGHPLTTGGIDKTNMSADYPGAVRAYLEKAMPNCLVTFLQGCAGDMNTRSNIPEENPPQDYYQYGDLLGAQMLQILEKPMTPVKTGPIKTASHVYVGKVNHTLDHMVERCKEINKFFVDTGDRRSANIMSLKEGLASVYESIAVTTRAGMGETLPVELFAFSIGELGVVSAPQETFHKLGEYVRAESPFPFTLTLGYTNGYRGYMPTIEGFEYGCYEADTCRFLSGTGEEIAQEQLKLLHAVK